MIDAMERSCVWTAAQTPHYFFMSCSSWGTLSVLSAGPVMLSGCYSSEVFWVESAGPNITLREPGSFLTSFTSSLVLQPRCCNAHGPLPHSLKINCQLSENTYRSKNLNALIPPKPPGFPGEMLLLFELEAEHFLPRRLSSDAWMSLNVLF